MTLNYRTAYRTTLELEPGDVLELHGFAVELGDVTTGPANVRWSTGTVVEILDPAQARHAGVMAIGDVWTVQGNGTARWHVRIGAPELVELELPGGTLADLARFSPFEIRRELERDGYPPELAAAVFAVISAARDAVLPPAPRQARRRTATR